MGDKTSIEWTDATLSTRISFCGIETRDTKGCSGEDRVIAGGVSGQRCERSEVVHGMFGVASARRLRRRPQPDGWTLAPVPLVAPRASACDLYANASATSGPILRSGQGRRREAGATQGELLRGIWTHPTPSRPTVRRLWALVEAGWSAS